MKFYQHPLEDNHVIGFDDQGNATLFIDEKNKGSIPADSNKATDAILANKIVSNPQDASQPKVDK